MAFKLTVNGRSSTVDVPADMPLLWALRDVLEMRGTKYGCGIGQCGACTILLDGMSVKSCTVLAAQIAGSDIVTIEGLAHAGEMISIQTALWEYHGVQCGYCTPGLVLSLTDLLRKDPSPSESEIRRWMDGNLCRCGVYQNAVRAVRSLAKSAGRPA